jgi:predicted GIY-YIG superfamily endonuclease
MKLIDILFETIVEATKYSDDDIWDEATKKDENGEYVYKTRDQFKNGAPWAYRAAKNRKVLDVVCLNMDVPKRGIRKTDSDYEEKIANANKINGTTDEDLLKKGEEAAKKYDNPKTFQTNEPGLYSDLSDRKLLPKIAHLYKNRKRDKYTYDELKSVTSKYETKRDLEKENPRIYWAAYSSPYWSELTSHMKTLGNLKKRLVYVYEFPELKTAYVGLTGDEDTRIKQHKTDSQSSLYKFMQNNIGLDPIYKVKSLGYIDYQEAAKMEIETEKWYRNNGWTLLNRVKTGGLGRTIIYMDELVKKLAKNYNVLSDFWRDHRKMLETVSRYRKQLYNQVTKGMTKYIKKNK